MLTCCQSPSGATPGLARSGVHHPAVGGREDHVGIDLGVLSVVGRTVGVAEERDDRGGKGEQRDGGATVPGERSGRGGHGSDGGRRRGGGIESHGGTDPVR